MKTNQITIALLSLACITLFGNCGGEDPTGEIKAAVSATCGSTINYDGTNTFAYKSFGQLLVGGYPLGDGKELGIFLPWPPVNGTYNLGSPDVGVYYDPVNSCDDCPADGVDQYGYTGGGGQIVLLDVQLSGENVTLVDLTFSNIIVTHQDTSTFIIDTLCLNAGIIKFD